MNAQVGPGSDADVRVSTNSTTVRFTAQSKGDFDSVGSTITFSTKLVNGHVYLSQSARADSTMLHVFAARFGVAVPLWYAQYRNFQTLLFRDAAPAVAAVVGAGETMEHWSFGCGVERRC